MNITFTQINDMNDLFEISKNTQDTKYGLIKQ